MTITLERMLKGYVECMEWADCGPDHETYGKDWSEELADKNRADCAAFIETCGVTLLDHLAELAPDYSDECFGHDFWLTRNGHGAGYWDRKELEARTAIGDAIGGYTLGERLTFCAKHAGQCELYVGDDGLVYA